MDFSSIITYSADLSNSVLQLPQYLDDPLSFLTSIYPETPTLPPPRVLLPPRAFVTARAGPSHSYTVGQSQSPRVSSSFNSASQAGWSSSSLVD